MIISKKNLYSFFTGLFLFCIFFTSCQNEQRIYLKDGLEWAPYTDTIAFNPVTDYKRSNLSNLPSVGKDGKYIWLRFKFTIPDALKNQDLVLVIPYLHFSYEVYFNSEYMDTVGQFPPEEFSSLYQAHSFLLHKAKLNQQGENQILIKVWCKGKARISPDAFIGKTKDSFLFKNNYSFWHSLFFIAYEGGMFCAAVIYLFLFILGHREPQYLAFFLLNMATSVFMDYFFLDVVPLSSEILSSYLLIVKFILCIPAYVVFFMIGFFITAYLDADVSEKEKRICALVLFAQIIVTIFVRDINILRKIAPVMLTTGLLQVAYGLVYFTKAFKIPEKVPRAKKLMYGFTPICVSIFIDLTIRLCFPQKVFPVFSLSGWQISIIYFLFLLTSDYYNLHKAVSFLNNDLENQVKLKTQSLSIANKELEESIRRAKIDLEMASIVQQQFFPYPNRNFKGWDIAIKYKPLSEVSGDLYDYYTKEERLNGISLFDVSGHGIASSLITMLAKHTIFQLFNKSLTSNEPVSETLMKFNEQFTEAKGNVDNYLTGLLFRFSDFDENDACTVQMANAAHPYPILYTKRNDSIRFIKPENTDRQFGSIGMKDLDVSFLENQFLMEKGDVLVCFTDCLSESMNKEHEQFDSSRIQQVVHKNSAKTASQILSALTNALEDFTEGVPLNDDLTIIVLKREDSSIYLEELI